MLHLHVVCSSSDLPHLPCFTSGFPDYSSLCSCVAPPLLLDLSEDPPFPLQLLLHYLFYLFELDFNLRDFILLLICFMKVSISPIPRLPLWRHNKSCCCMSSLVVAIQTHVPML